MKCVKINEVSFEVYFWEGCVLRLMDASRETLIAVFGEDMVVNHMDKICRFMTEHPDEYHQKVWNYYANKRNENMHICRECGGSCCKNVPCHFSPDDFEDLSYRAMKRLMKKKQYISVVRFSKRIVEMSFDYEVGSTYKHFYILRIRTSGTGIAARAGEINDGDLCMLLTETGCKLSYEERPKGARMLIPKWESQCEQLYNMDDCVHDWVLHQKLLKKLYDYFEMWEKIKEILKRVHL